MKRIVFMGTPDFSVPVLEALLKTDHEIVLAVTQPDRPKGRKKVLTPSPVKQAAEKYDIPVFQPERLAKDFQAIRDAEPDLIITAAYGQILPDELLTIPPFGAINVHASLLPELRGGAPIHYAILQGKKTTGITIMYMVNKLDAGDILSQTSVTIADTDTVGLLHDKLATAGAGLLVDTLPDLFASRLSPTPQTHEQATFARNITREQEKIDWQDSSEAIYNQIRGLNPWPVAFTTLHGKPMKIWWGNLTGTHYNGTPGEIVHVDESDFTVVCGDGLGLRISEIQPAGKKRMTVADFLRGSADQLSVNMKLGDDIDAR